MKTFAQALKTENKSALGVYQANGCCGVAELHGIEDPGHSAWGNLFYLAHSYRQPRCAIWFFTSVYAPALGHEMKRIIQAEGLGVVKSHAPIENPNSGNKITFFSWAIDKEGWAEFCRKVHDKNALLRR